MAGNVVFVSGLSGAGKTTLIRCALENYPNLVYLKTLTTRPPRPGEEHSLEYEFVTEGEYKEARSASAQWDHTKYDGYWYGADVESVRQRLAQGIHVICSVAPRLQIIKEMAELYGTKPLTIWIDTPKHITQKRVAGDTMRSSRIEDESVKQYFDYTFKPSGHIDVDCRAFIKMLRDRLN